MIQRLVITSINQSSRMIQKNAYTYIPPSCYQISKKHNPVLSVTLANSQINYCTLKFRLFENTVPKTAENFRRLLLGNASYLGKQLSLIGTGIKRHVPRAFIEMGHMEQGKNCSIYGQTFRDQSFELIHDRPGLLSSISKQNTNSSPFVITLAPCPFLDYKNVVFGQIDPESMETLRNLERDIGKFESLRISAVQELVQQVSHHDHGHHH